MRSRINNARRDVLPSRLTIQKIHVYDAKAPGEARTIFKIRSFSFPQYAPYYTRTDSRGRRRTRQRSYMHHYDVIISLDQLSIDVPVKMRTGSSVAWDFRSKTRKVHGRIIESRNQLRGRNGDFFFRLEWLYSAVGILYGRNWTNGPPRQTNPRSVVFLDKHAFTVVRFMMERGILTQGQQALRELEAGRT